MKNKILLFLLLTLATHVSAQQLIEWQHHYGGTGDDRVQTIIPSPDGGFILLGFSSSSNIDVADNNGNNDFWLVKTDDEGVLLWETNMGGAGLDAGRDILVTGDGGYLLVGYSQSINGDVGDNNGNYDFWVVKTNELGAIQWETNLGGTDNDRAWSVTTTPEGGYIIIGFSYSDNVDVSDNNGSGDYWIVKLDASGSILWENNYGGSKRDRGSDIERTVDGGYILLGFTDSEDGDVGDNNGGDDFWVVKINAIGVLEWEKNFGGSNDETAWGIMQTPDGSYIVIGNSASSDGDVSINNGGEDGWIFKLNADGNMIWERSYGGTKEDNFRDVKPCMDGGFIITGETASSDGDVSINKGALDAWIVKTNAEGLLEWEITLGGSEDDLGYSILETPYHSYLLAGYSRSSDGDVAGNYGLNDYWIVKIQDCVFPELNQDIITACEENMGSGIATFQLTNAYDSLTIPNGLTTEWFTDQNGTLPINNTDTHTTDGATVFLQFSIGDCRSEIIPIQLIVNPLPAVTTIDEIICADDLPFTINGQTFDQSGTYPVEGFTNMQGCDSIVILNLEIIYLTDLEMAAAGDDQLVSAPMATLSGNEPPEVFGSWSTLNGGDIEAELEATTLVSNLTEGHHKFIWSLQHPLCGVYAMDTVDIHYQLDFFLPNTFTPNEDGDNDRFTIPGLFNNGATNFRFMVFNRYGALVYDVQPYGNDWDGKDRKGRDLKEGTYYFVLRNGEGIEYKGSILLVR